MKRLKKKARSSGVSLDLGAKKVAAVQGIKNTPSAENSKVLRKT